MKPFSSKWPRRPPFQVLVIAIYPLESDFSFHNYIIIYPSTIHRHIQISAKIETYFLFIYVLFYSQSVHELTGINYNYSAGRISITALIFLDKKLFYNFSDLFEILIETWCAPQRPPTKTVLFRSIFGLGSEFLKSEKQCLSSF